MKISGGLINDRSGTAESHGQILKSLILNQAKILLVSQETFCLSITGLVLQHRPRQCTFIPDGIVSRSIKLWGNGGTNNNLSSPPQNARPAQCTIVSSKWIESTYDWRIESKDFFFQTHRKNVQLAMSVGSLICSMDWGWELGSEFVKWWPQCAWCCTKS